MMPNYIIQEACVQSLEEALVAQKLGANRLEYCSHLELDGLTPDITQFPKILSQIKIPIMVMIRPRAGNFEYSNEEFEEMKASIGNFKNFNIKGFVFGIVKDQQLDFERTKILAEFAAPFDVCIHKAIDEVDDIIAAVKGLNEIPEVTRILSSGKAKTAQEGIPVLKEMLSVARSSLSIMPAGRVKASNIQHLHDEINAQEYHGRSIMMNF